MVWYRQENNNMQQENFYFTDRQISSLLPDEIRRLIKVAKSCSRVLDVGCGDGVMIYDLQRMNILGTKCQLTAVDISPKNISVAKKRIKNVEFCIADASSLPFANSSFDFVYSWMVIEHLSHPLDMVKEMSRVMKKGARCYISTIMKDKKAVYFYRQNKQFVLDPTHVNEFQTEAEFSELMRKAGLKVLRLEKSQRSYSVLELLFKGLIKFQIIQPKSETREFFKDHLWINSLRKKLVIPVPGFYQLEALCELN